jgi:PIN domain nuclease of toxin-antitoxin system
MVMPYVTDTHSLIWYLTDDPKLSATAKRTFEWADIFQDYIYIPCIVFFELLYLIKKKKINVDFDSFIKLVSSSKNYRVEPLCLPIIENSRKIHKKVVDPWDRLIAATSMHLNAPLISKDRLLRGIGLEVIW